jgi:hypothetical protein
VKLPPIIVTAAVLFASGAAADPPQLPEGVGSSTEVLLGAAFFIAWALVLLWSLGRIAVSAWRTLGKGAHNWDPRSFGVGVLVGAALAAGPILFVEPEAVLFGAHTIGLGFLLTLAATFVLWVFAKAGSL